MTGRGLIKNQTNRWSEEQRDQNVSPNHLEPLWTQKHQHVGGKGCTQEDTVVAEEEAGVCKESPQEQRHLEARTGRQALNERDYNGGMS